MKHPPFNPANELRFDLGRGRVSLGGATSSVLVAADALLALCKSAGPAAVTDFGRRLGTEAGRRAVGRLAGGMESASVEAVLEHLGGDLAMLGLGSLGLERWGKALVMTVEGAPTGREGDALLAAVIEGALQRAAARDVRAIVLERSDDRVRLLLVSPRAAEQVQGWIDGGAGWGEVLAKLSSGD